MARAGLVAEVCNQNHDGIVQKAGFYDETRINEIQ